MPSRWLVRVWVSIPLAIHLFKVACYEGEIRSWREIAWKNIRDLDTLESRSTIRDVREGVDVRINRVLVNLLCPSWDRDQGEGRVALCLMRTD